MVVPGVIDGAIASNSGGDRTSAKPTRSPPSNRLYEPTKGPSSSAYDPLPNGLTGTPEGDPNQYQASAGVASAASSSMRLAAVSQT